MGRRDVHIEAKAYDVDAAAETLLRVLRANARVEVTAADASALSGVPLEQCQPALIALSSTYPSRLRVTSTGAVLFAFESLTARPVPGRVRAALAALRSQVVRHRDGALAIFTVLVVPPFLGLLAANIWALAAWAHELPLWAEIPIALVVWPMLYLVFTLAFLSLVVFHVFPAIGVVLLGMTVALPVAAVMDLWGDAWWKIALVLAILVVPMLVMGYAGTFLCKLAWETLRDVVATDRASAARGFWRAVGGFLLGPLEGTDDADGLADERRLVALIRERRGVITGLDLMALFGWSAEQADREVTRVLADYGGDIVVTDDGALVYVFDPLMESAATAPSAGAPPNPSPAYEVETMVPRFFGCSPALAGWVLAALGMGLLGLALLPDLYLFPLAADYVALADAVHARGADEVLLMQGLGAWPYLLPVATLGLRVPFWLLARRSFVERASFLALLRVAATSPEGTRVAAFRSDHLAALGGELLPDAPDPAGRVRVRFPELALARRAAEVVRARATPPPLGDVVFDTNE